MDQEAKMIQVSLKVEPKLWGALVEQAKRLKLSRSWLVRQYCQRGLEADKEREKERRKNGTQGISVLITAILWAAQFV